MASGRDLERLVRRLDRSLNTLERTAITRLANALRLSEARLEAELRRLYMASLEETLTSGAALREARARLLLQQVRASLDVTAGAAADDVFTALVREAYAAGMDNAIAALSLYQQQVVSLSAGVRIEAAVRATNAAARLAQHGTVFAEKAEQLIIDGIVRGQGWGRTARELRRETGKTLRQTEMIVRTESITASDSARRDSYRENGVEYVQRMATMDERVCGYCAYRAGNVYRVEDAPAAIHPNDRCYNAPWKPEWQELGLTDDEWFRQHRAEAIERSGEKPKSGAAPFEKSEGRPAPQPVWSP